MSVAKSISLLLLLAYSTVSFSQVEPPKEHQWKTVEEFLDAKGISANSTVPTIQNTFFDVTSNRERIHKILTYPTVYAICNGSKEDGLSSLVNCCNFSKLPMATRNKFASLCSTISTQVMDDEINSTTGKRKLAYWLAKQQHNFYAENYKTKLVSGSNEYVFYANFERNRTGENDKPVAAENQAPPKTEKINKKPIKEPQVVTRNKAENSKTIKQLNERIANLEKEVGSINPGTLTKTKNSWLEWLGYAMLTLILWFIIGTVLHVLGRKNFLSQSSLKIKEAVRSLFSSSAYKGNQERLQVFVQNEVSKHLGKNSKYKYQPAKTDKEVKVMPEIEAIIQKIISKQNVASGETVKNIENRLSNVDKMVENIFQEMNDESLIQELISKELAKQPVVQQSYAEGTTITEEIDPKKLSAQVQWQVTEFLSKNPETLARLLPAPTVEQQVVEEVDPQKLKAQVALQVTEYLNKNKDLLAGFLPKQEAATQVVKEEVDPKKLSAQVQWQVSELLKKQPDLVTRHIPAPEPVEKFNTEAFKEELGQFFASKIEAHLKWLDDQFIAFKDDIKNREAEYSDSVSKKYETDFDQRLFQQTEIIANLQDDLRSYLPNTEVKQLVVKELDKYKKELESKNRHLREAETMIQRLGEKISEIEYRNDQLQKKVYRLERGKD